MHHVLTNVNMTIDEMIDRAGLTRVELARRAGLTRAGLYLWMRRPSMGKATTAQGVARALGVTVEELLRAKGKKHGKHADR